MLDLHYPKWTILLCRDRLETVIKYVSAAKLTRCQEYPAHSFRSHQPIRAVVEHTLFSNNKLPEPYPSYALGLAWKAAIVNR